MNYSDIPIRIYKKINDLDDADEIVKYVYNYSEDQLDEMEMEEYSNLISSVLNLKDYNFVKYNKLKIDDNIFKYKDILDITFGEYLDLQNFAKNNDIEKIMTIFWRLPIENDRKYDQVKLENYHFDTNIRSEIFKEVSCKYYFQIQKDILKLEDLIKNNFDDLFNESGEKPESIEFENKRDELEYIHNQKIRKSYSKNAWKYTTYALSGGDILKFEEVYDLNFIFVLNFMKLEKDLELRKNNNKKI